MYFFGYKICTDIKHFCVCAEIFARNYLLISITLGISEDVSVRLAFLRVASAGIYPFSPFDHSVYVLVKERNTKFIDSTADC